MEKKSPHIGRDALAHIAELKARSPKFAAAFDAEYAQLQVARQVKALREHTGISQAELAKRVGTQQPSIARVESGKSEPSLGLLWKIAAAVGQSVEIRFVGIEKRSPRRQKSGGRASGDVRT